MPWIHSPNGEDSRRILRYIPPPPSRNFREQIKEDAKNSFNVRDEFKELTYEEIKAIHLEDRVPISVALLNATGELNIGTVIRSASLLGMQEVILFGRSKYDARSTVGAQHYLPVTKVSDTYNQASDISEAITKYLNFHFFTPIYFETGNYPSIHEVNWPHLLEAKKPCLVFGSEGNGIPETLLHNLSGPIFRIPQRGVLRSFNLGVAASIAMYEISRQMGWLDV